MLLILVPAAIPASTNVAKNAWANAIEPAVPKAQLERLFFILF
ncbi:hypothetical protein L915_01988 [Phytophthora nicotianae]|uniref:Uncharacterized protein n=1 Tax=Phytophthora nicotianae TaxID=4792 RepID=W2JS12_PHYNI|nr:hypothetical protein L915_01988 [Phytophthora nicotianae]ETL48463.1 hypothetical protein L916_01942 [Phytophthora nicotianae]